MKDEDKCPECETFWERCPCCNTSFYPDCGMLESDADYGEEDDDALLCPFCGDEMKHWNQGIYECENCDIMIPDDEDDEEETES
ncbi:hypothetical protein [Paenibacillus thiaminolyticus]|uniref:hypothetical protein n=1 Tax=Paenibacillus thiaminolyticus TaxID=49283 RepID=UPI002542D532|nr:hypothetical protein [Paenibacillus thiaminolyticus]WII39176.1 hypothetical protein O0V01_08845 [Paenibacillus thiaminolyticus]